MKTVLVHSRGIRVLAEIPDPRDQLVVSCGHGHGLVINGDGVLSFGSNDESQLGRGAEIDGANEPALVEGVRNVVGVATGDKHSVAIDAVGHVFSWGGSALVRGRSGPSSRAMRVTRGLDDPSLSISHVSCGAEHTIVLDRSGRLYGWGEARDGQLGLLSKQPIVRPTSLTLPDQVAAVMVACGEKHSLVVAADLRVFASGVAPATGLDVDCEEFRPIQRLCGLREKDPVVRIACGRNHSLAATPSVLFAFGDGSCGKLGSGTEEDRLEPAPVELPREVFPLRNISGGPHHSIIVDASHRVWACGLSGLLDTLMTRDYTEKASRAPGSVAMARMVAKFELAEAIVGNVSQVALGADMALLLLKSDKGDVGSAVLGTPPSKLSIPAPAWFERMASGDDVRVAVLGEKLKASEQRCIQLQHEVQSLQALLDQLGPHYRHDPAKAAARIRDLEAQVLI